MVKAYRKGARYERRAREELEAKGYYVMRSAGSRGPADLIAVKVLYVQVKATDDPRAWTGELEQMSQQLPTGPGIVKELWAWHKRKWEKHRVDETDH